VVAAALAECDLLVAVSDDLADRLSTDLDGGFPEVVATYGDTIYAIALRTARTPHDAEDLAAETFLRAYSALREYTRDRISALALRPWLVTILLNTWRNSVRAAARRPQTQPLDSDVDVASAAPAPVDVAASHDAEDRLVALLAALPDRQRLAIVLHHVGDLGYAEVAAVMRIPETTARSHVARGLKTLRALARDAGLEELA
jgi:RNA polymerase sigma-70 factor, ECF subfamily